ncbi:MAG: hypothetical protein HXS52_12875 [Theionarchaea archaeon]|nr:hypothetical protein [Theionarchaea archaeon]MBU7038818.1 hypothetical protein [Theionarchaea archaeon]
MSWPERIRDTIPATAFCILHPEAIGFNEMTQECRKTFKVVGIGRHGESMEKVCLLEELSKGQIHVSGHVLLGLSRMKENCSIWAIPALKRG